MAAALAGHPGLAGWYTADKRKADEAERVFHQYTILRSAAPGGITPGTAGDGDGLQQSSCHSYDHVGISSETENPFKT